MLRVNKGKEIVVINFSFVVLVYNRSGGRGVVLVVSNKFSSCFHEKAFKSILENSKAKDMDPLIALST